MTGRLDKAMEWATTRVPVRVCWTCGFPAVGHTIKKFCPDCGIENVLNPRTGMTAPWDSSRPWAPEGCLVVVDETHEKRPDYFDASQAV